jgi:hypothetical protein
MPQCTSLFGVSKIGHEKPVFLFLVVPDDQDVDGADLSALSKQNIGQKGFLSWRQLYLSQGQPFVLMSDQEPVAVRQT